MADDDQDGAREKGAERKAEVKSEMEDIDRDPDEVNEGSEAIGTQNAASGTPREEEASEPDSGDDEPAEAAESDEAS